MTRTVTKLLTETFSQLGEGHIQPRLLEIWEKSGTGEAVAAEAMVALELASRDVTKTRRMTFSRLEETEPDLIAPLFKAAIARTESKTKEKPK